MKRTTLLSATLIAFALPLSAQDSAGWTPGENFIDSWDYDGDGKVTLDEVLERRGDLFMSFDDNEDGQLTAAEFANHDQMRDAMWDARDSARDDAAVTQGAG
ncbi:MAG TPA: calcium-binding protein, partial [Rhodobacteraceae bacterium]|nr:calcium-binding protein [Paracoccaceae bacterium]